MDVSIGTMYRRTQQNAKKRGIIFDLSIKTYSATVFLDCAYCGLPASQSNTFTRKLRVQKRTSPLKLYKAVHEVRYNGLDRIDNTVGYLDGNIAPCCKQCNVAKQDFTHQEFMEWVKRIHDKHCT